MHDSGDGRPCVGDPDGESGRGLSPADAPADAWGVGRRDPGKAVWCAFTWP
ncbi:hypothetical protein ACFWDI_21540 [Streptomyces sp. NPDC060064]|uniref:hypothetical protein n=1 Tax=Streptomyces sp. NPDC060064 TaxID=3347049 RepID=UPI0036C0B6AE